MRLLLAVLVLGEVFLTVMLARLANATNECIDALEALHRDHQHEKPRGEGLVELSGPVVRDDQ